ncbi:MAG: sigma-54-dependent Fis family transcriptional regulator [Phycisphaerales bacterium]|nr:sigma-54-dependent Fis family transcriptional regulator [Phycisphaerales bacterium]
MSAESNIEAIDRVCSDDERPIRILVVDDDSSMRNALRRVLRREDVVHVLAPDGENALREVTQRPSDHFSVAIIDLNMPGIDGQTVLMQLKRHSPNTQAIILTGRGTIQEAVRSTRNGADDFIEKPFDVGELRRRVWSACRIWARRKATSTTNAGKPNSPDGPIVGGSILMQSIMRTAERIASNDATILIRGETGTGKSFLARAIHRMSPRRDQPFVVVDLASLGPQLIESELFGHARGAYTGASDVRDGLIRTAGGGTVFLDEIGELSLSLQVKLLHVLQERKVRPVGSDVSFATNSRFIAATNKDLESAVRQGSFREDLYYRLNVMEITIPPLRERRDDVPALLDYFIRRHRESTGVSTAFDDNAMRVLESHDWPGNVREIDNVVLRAMLLSQGPRIVEADLPPQVRLSSASNQSEKSNSLIAESASNAGSGKTPRAGTLAAYEREAILAALRASGGNRRLAAEILEIGPATLYRKLKKYGISD